MTGITDPTEEYFKDGLWAWVTDQWKKLVADASSFLQVNISAQDIDVEIKQQTAADLTPGVKGWDGSMWRKLSLLWGYNDRLHEDLGGTKSGAGLYSAYSTAVPAGEIHVVQAMSFRNVSGVRSRAQLRAYSNSAYIILDNVEAPAQYAPLIVLGMYTLKEGDRVRVLQNACLDGDGLEAGVWGYKMKVAE